MRTIPILVAAAALLAPSLAQDSAAFSTHDWRAFRGTDGAAGSGGRFPATWDDEKNLKWKRRLPGPGTSSPIVVGEAVFVTCWTGYGLDRDAPGDPTKLRRHLLRIDRNTGAIVWQRDILPVATEDEFGGRMAVHGYASSTPVSDGKHIWVFFGKSGVFAFDLDGEQLWHADVGKGSSKWKTGSGSSPSLWRDLLFVNASDESHALYALNKDTGKEVWKRATEAMDQAYGVPVVAREPEPVVLLALLGGICALEPQTGKSRWTVQTLTDGALAPTIVLGASRRLISFGGQTRKRSYAVRLGGTGDVTKTHVDWSSKYGSYVVTPLVHDGHVYWVNEGGIAHCAKEESGELVYKKRLDGSFYSSPVRAGDVILMVSREAGTFVLPAKPEFAVLHQNRFAEDQSNFDGTPALSDRQVFLRSARCLYCVSQRPRTGSATPPKAAPPGGKK